MPTPLIELEGVSKRYGPLTALSEVDLRVEGETVYALVGSNGAGKTTALAAVMGLVHQDSGEIRVGGVDTRSPEIHEMMRSVGYVPQRSVLYEQLTGGEFLRFVGGLYQVKSEGFRATDRLIESLGMTEAARLPIRTYSVGMKRRIAILAATIHEPRYLVLDEPTTSLDGESARILENRISACRREGGLVFFSTHRLDMVERLADRVGVLEDGRLVFDGTLDVFQAGRLGTPAAARCTTGPCG